MIRSSEALILIPVFLTECNCYSGTISFVIVVRKVKTNCSNNIERTCPSLLWKFSIIFQEEPLAVNLIYFKDYLCFKFRLQSNHYDRYTCIEFLPYF